MYLALLFPAAAKVLFVLGVLACVLFVILLWIEHTFWRPAYERAERARQDAILEAERLEREAKARIERQQEIRDARRWKKERRAAEKAEHRAIYRSSARR